MIISYSKHGKSGGVDYAIKNDTARVLEGDPKLTKSLIEQSKNKLKYRSGIISFEEKNPSKEVIQDVIAEFKRSTFAGLDQEQYNLLLVEHTNTDRYHIHFTIPRVELTSGKSFNPHWHQEDQTRLLKLQDYLNAKHGLSNPYQAEKRSTLESIDTKALNRNQTKEEINKHIEELVIAQKLQNRDEVVQYFKESGIDVVRQSKNFITVQLDDERIRLKGTYYAETFKDYGAVAEELTRAEREHIQTSQGQLNELKQELDRLVQHKAITNREKYPKLEKEYDRGHQPRTKDTKKEQDLQVHRHSSNELGIGSSSNMVSKAEPSRNDSPDKDRVQADRELRASEQAYRGKEELTRTDRPTPSNENSEQRVNTRTPSVEHTEEYEKNGQRGQVSKNETRLPRRGVELQVGTDKGLENDSVGTRAIKRARSTRETQQELISSIGTEGKEVYRGLNESYKAIRGNYPADKERIREYTKGGISEEQRAIRGIHEEREIKQPSLAERFKEAYRHAKEYIEIAKAKAKEAWQKLQESLERQKAIEKELAKQKEQQQSRSRGFSLSR